jgi:hypothetical protein
VFSQTTSAPQTRRALLGAGLGALVASVAEALGRGAPTHAANGNIVTVGGTFTGTTRTKLTNTSSYGDAIEVASTSGNGIYATSESNAGVYGLSNTHIGVFGFSGVGGTAGVYGQSYDPGTAAAIGHSAGNSTGVLGFSGPSMGLGFAPPAPKAKTGVFGHAAQDGGSRGVWGNSPAGHGVHGSSDSGWAGYFDGRVLANSYHELVEIGTPSAPSANHARLFVRDNGAGKTQLCVRFPSGAVKVLATQA